MIRRERARLAAQANSDASDRACLAPQAETSAAYRHRLAPQAETSAAYRHRLAPQAKASATYRRRLAPQAAVYHQHPLPHPPELLIPPRIRRAPPLVIPAIHFHDEAHGRSGEVRDEATERKLPAKTRADPPTSNGLPKLLLRRRQRRPHLPSAKLHVSRNVNASA
jgi:hypothetical protein